MVSNLRGSRSRLATLVAAAASVGPTAVPSTNEMAQDRCPTQWLTAATAKAVAMTSSTARVPMERASRRNPVGDDVTAASNTNSGSRPSSTTSGCRETSGTNGRKPMINPAKTNTTAAGMPARRKTATAVTVTEARQRMMRI
jgi:hypothetical protein